MEQFQKFFQKKSVILEKNQENWPTKIAFQNQKIFLPENFQKISFHQNVKKTKQKSTLFANYRDKKCAFFS